MGWFLSSKKTKKRRTPRRAGLSEPKPWDPKRTLAGLKALGGFALAVALVIGWRYGERYLLNYASQTKAARITPAQVQLIDAPAWMNPTIRDQIRQSASILIDPDPMDGKSLRRAADALRQDPWVRRVRQVTRRSGARILVSAEYRRPVAVIEARDGYHLIDAEGVCLPGLYNRHEVDRIGLVTITGVRTPPPAAAGEVWPGEAVRAGLALLKLLADEPYLDKVERVDAGQRDQRGRLRLLLHTHAGAFMWGLPPGEENALETDVRTKLSWLRQLAQADASLNTHGQIIDINGPVPATRQP